MFPVKDDNPTKSTPLITYSLIFLNVTIFIYEIVLESQNKLEGFIYTFALIPGDIIQGYGLYALLTSIFLHAGFVHLLGNMLYLHIFGDNIEDLMGKKRFVVFYIVCGLAASLLQIYVNPYSKVPNLGASGAIAGILGAYLVTFPRARVHCILTLGYFIRWVTLPAIFVLGMWFVLQLFSGVGSLSYISEDAGGVAYFAHIGGFVAGMLLVKIFRK
ncbi:MAG: rhomboid family intramembrane serine protease [Euryarchaeota archaeon]|nr:rhomboid family intramembrane serine protease [Euryarchaeota archaeon]